jgi:hypothetical protein
MKNFLIGLITATLLATPAYADHQDNRPNNDRRGGGCGWLCGALIGGVVVGALSSDSRTRRNQDRNDDNRYYPPNSRYDERYCVREQIVEWRGGERYIYWQTTCN